MVSSSCVRISPSNFPLRRYTWPRNGWSSVPTWQPSQSFALSRSSTPWLRRLIIHQTRRQVMCLLAFSMAPMEFCSTKRLLSVRMVPPQSISLVRSALRPRDASTIKLSSLISKSGLPPIFLHQKESLLKQSKQARTSASISSSYRQKTASYPDMLPSIDLVYQSWPSEKTKESSRI